MKYNVLVSTWTESPKEELQRKPATVLFPPKKYEKTEGT